jgi:hypothetical protein
MMAGITPYFKGTIGNPKALEKGSMTGTRLEAQNTSALLFWLQFAIGSIVPNTQIQIHNGQGTQRL